jgi:hypothetical protein
MAALVRKMTHGEALERDPNSAEQDMPLGDRPLESPCVGRCVWRTAPFSLSCSKTDLTDLRADPTTLRLLQQARRAAEAWVGAAPDDFSDVEAARLAACYGLPPAHGALLKKQMEDIQGLSTRVQKQRLKEIERSVASMVSAGAS